MSTAVFAIPPCAGDGLRSHPCRISRVVMHPAERRGDTQAAAGPGGA